MTDEGGSSEREQRGPRRLAEWVTFGVSLVLVLGVAAQLVWSLSEPVTDMVDARVKPRLDRVAQQEGRFVLPVEVVNPGARTIRDVQVRIDYRAGGGERRSMDVLVDILGRSSEQVVYTYFEEDPRRLSIRAEAISYRVD